jgi:hypothetical protein
MISAQRINKLMVYLCKHLPAKDVEAMKTEIEEILGFDLEKAGRLRRLKKERDGVTDSLAATSI